MNSTRRNFIRQSSLGIGAGITGFSVSSCRKDSPGETKRLDREIIVATIDLRELLPPDSTRESRVKKVLERMNDVAGLKPDIICLPELFDTMWVTEEKPISEVAEDENIPGPVTSRIAEFAKKHNCYVACPVYTKKDGHFYNSSLLIDRKGSIAGVYHKIHPEKSEILPDQSKGNVGITPGALDQPLFETDFGKVGMQISDDANWSDGWDNLKKQGAEVILFSSAFPGGRMLNYFAWRNNCYIISSSGVNARVVDMSGNDLDSSSTFVCMAWAKINLEKLNTDTWAANRRLPDLFNKYGDKLGIKVWNNTNTVTIESLDPEVKIKDILKEFELQTVDQEIETSHLVQDKYRL